MRFLFLAALLLLPGCDPTEVRAPRDSAPSNSQWEHARPGSVLESPGSNGSRVHIARCVSVRDGDTIEVLSDQKQQRIRVQGIDTPEYGQPFFRRAKQFTAEMCHGKVVRIHEQEVDRWDRIVGAVYIDDVSLSHELVRAGLAWHYERYSDDPQLASLQEEARRQRLGIWSEASPTPPWEWRRASRDREK